MSKTPEEMAEEYTRDWWGTLPEAEGMRKSARENFLAGYKAAAPQWISVKDRLPEDNDIVLIVFQGSVVSVAFYEGDWRHPLYPQTALVSVTHWMPLPEPPKEEE